MLTLAEHGNSGGSTPVTTPLDVTEVGYIGLAVIGSTRKRIPWLICRNEDAAAGSSGFGSTNRRRASGWRTDRMKMIR